MDAKLPQESSLAAEPSRAENPQPCPEPLSMTQKTAARRMMQSARDIPQFSVSMEVSADALAVRRSRINADVEDKESQVSPDYSSSCETKS